jgi:hypothetical protein
MFRYSLQLSSLLVFAKVRAVSGTFAFESQAGIAVVSRAAKQTPTIKAKATRDDSIKRIMRLPHLPRHT